MTTLFAETALLPEGWAENVLIEVDDDGWMVGVHPGKPDAKSDATVLGGPVIPGMPNLHSHAFQRVMAGLTERAGGKKESFWSWRETMYRFLANMGPEEMKAVASLLYIEMLKAGYTAVGEFHYVHHQPDGKPYDDRSTLSQAVIQAGIETGIGMLHMPVLYAFGGFGGVDPSEGQKRFLNQPKELLQILESLRKKYEDNAQVEIGFAHHSLRAVSPDMLAEATAAVRELDAEIPIHIHAAEQSAEVERCIDWSQKRPVEWLLENAGLDKSWTVVHATHLTDTETKALAESGAVVCLCPTTEANLGDGIFPLAQFLEAGGVFGIGSDSHVSVSVSEELRWLEYAQRLIRQERTIVRSDEIPSVGAALYEHALRGGRRSLGRRTGKIETGYRADLVVLDSEKPAMVNKVRDHLLDSYIFAGNVNPVRDVIAGGRHVVRQGRHAMEEEALKKYRAVLEKL